MIYHISRLSRKTKHRSRWSLSENQDAKHAPWYKVILHVFFYPWHIHQHRSSTQTVWFVEHAFHHLTKIETLEIKHLKTTRVTTKEPSNGVVKCSKYRTLYLQIGSFSIYVYAHQISKRLGVRVRPSPFKKTITRKSTITQTKPKQYPRIYKVILNHTYIHFSRVHVQA